MSIFDYVSGAKEGKKPYHSHEFADKDRQERIGSTAESPFQKRQKIEKERKKVGAYKFSKIAYGADAKRVLIKSKKQQELLRKQWLLNRAVYGISRPAIAVNLRTIPSIQQYRQKPTKRKKKRFSKVYMAQPGVTSSSNSENVAKTS